MKAQVIEARLEIDGIGRRYPDRRPIARLAPHAQGCKALLRVREAKLSGKPGKEFPRLSRKRQLGLRQPRAQRRILKPAATPRGQHDERRIFVI